MESSVALLIFIIFLCIVTSAFFSSSETALFSLNKYKLKTAVSKNTRGAASAQFLLNNPDRLISTILICNNIVNIAASSLATIVGQMISGEIGIAISTGLLTFVLLMFAEIIPKTIASKFPEQVAYNLSPILYVVFNITKPIVWFFNVFTTLFFKLINIQQNNGSSSLSSDELRVIVKESQNLVGKDHSDMLNSILDLEELTIEDVMIPRHEVIGIDIDDDIKTIMRRINHSPVSRLVVYRESFDEQILGSLRIKEFYRLLQETGDESKETLMRAIDEPNFIPESIDLRRQLYNFKKNKRKFALVADEYGSFVGIITIDDILEEIVGNFTVNSIVDEEEDIALISSGKYVIDGQANLRDLNRKFGWKIDDEEARTLNGFLLAHYQDIPKEGSSFQSGGLIFKVLKASPLKVIDIEIIDTKRYKGHLSDKKDNETCTVVDADGHLSSEDISKVKASSKEEVSSLLKKKEKFFHKIKLPLLKASAKTKIFLKNLSAKKEELVIKHPLSAEGVKKIVSATGIVKTPSKAETNVETNAEAKAEAKVETKKTETKLESKAETKLETKPETKVEAKPETKPVTKPENKVESQEQRKKAFTTENQAENKAENKVENKAEAKTNLKAHAKITSATNKSEARVEKATNVPHPSKVPNAPKAPNASNAPKASVTQSSAVSVKDKQNSEKEALKAEPKKKAKNF